MDIFVLQRIHLCLLKTRHAMLRREHKHANPVLAAHRVFGSGAGVARGRTQDIQLAPGFG